MHTEVKELLDTILKVKHTEGKLISYAQSYAKTAIDNDMYGFMLRCQLSYVLNNLSGWRGPTATKVKARLKKLQKSLTSREELR